MKFSLFLILAAATTAIATSITPAHVKTVDAATYKAIANGTLSLADLPLVARRNDLQKRDAGNVYMCTAAYWQEYCVYITDAGPGECVNLAGDLNNLVSSIGPDPNQECYLYDEFDCNNLGQRLAPVRAPGYADLSQSIWLGGEGSGILFNDKMSSYQCFY
ncbi:hypothetical protein B0H14DRAFT_3491177 [Mycena olivaceomarginata]|nr:hypothetical protein B0H14DRAFT_3491177 [Mycena olivaceomarginata]